MIRKIASFHFAGRILRIVNKPHQSLLIYHNCEGQMQSKHSDVLTRTTRNSQKLQIPFLKSATGQTMGDKSVETLCHIGVLKVNFSPHLYNTTPSPLPNVGFQVSRICLFPLQHWKGGGGLALNINWIWNRISDMLQLALDSVNCLNYFCRPLSGVYLCKLWRFPLYIQALASLFLQKRLNAWFRLICD